MTGKDPESLDHINGNRSDNRWENLREASPLENQRNRKLNANNRSGKSGVCFVKNSQKWRAQIKVESKMIFLGDFRELGDAVEARGAGELKYLFHKNHGKIRTP